MQSRNLQIWWVQKHLPLTEEQVEYVYKFIYHWNFEDNSYTRNDEDIQKLTVVEKVAILNARKKNIVNEFNETEKE